MLPQSVDPFLQPSQLFIVIAHLDKADDLFNSFMPQKQIIQYERAQESSCISEEDCNQPHGEVWRKQCTSFMQLW